MLSCRWVNNVFYCSGLAGIIKFLLIIRNNEPFERSRSRFVSFCVDLDLSLTRSVALWLRTERKSGRKWHAFVTFTETTCEWLRLKSNCTLSFTQAVTLSRIEISLHNSQYETELNAGKTNAHTYSVSIFPFPFSQPLFVCMRTCVYVCVYMCM